MAAHSIFSSVYARPKDFPLGLEAIVAAHALTRCSPQRSSSSFLLHSLSDACIATESYGIANH
jgi:hypothetical protein